VSGRLVDAAAGSGGRVIRRVRLERIVQAPVTLGPIEYVAEGAPLGSSLRVDREPAAREVPVRRGRVEACDEKAGACLTNSDRHVGQFAALFRAAHRSEWYPARPSRSRTWRRLSAAVPSASARPSPAAGDFPPFPGKGQAARVCAVGPAGSAAATACSRRAISAWSHSLRSSGLTCSSSTKSSRREGSSQGGTGGSPAAGTGSNLIVRGGVVTDRLLDAADKARRCSAAEQEPCDQKEQSDRGGAVPSHFGPFEARHVHLGSSARRRLLRSPSNE
jgi:hypothetical protein